MPQADPQLPDENSKSKRKEESTGLQKLGESLLKLTATQLNQINLPENLLHALQEAKSLTSNGAIRRQMQYIGKIMRNVDAEPIKIALARIQMAHQQKTVQFHHAEEWREKLILAGDTALNEYMKEYPETDRQQLRVLIRKAQQDNKNDKNTGAATALFKFLRNSINE